jgi:hypothetical protein
LSSIEGDSTQFVSRSRSLPHTKLAVSECVVGDEIGRQAAAAREPVGNAAAHHQDGSARELDIGDIEVPRADAVVEQFAQRALVAVTLGDVRLRFSAVSERSSL